MTKKTALEPKPKRPYRRKVPITFRVLPKNLNAATWENHVENSSVEGPPVAVAWVWVMDPYDFLQLTRELGARNRYETFGEVGKAYLQTLVMEVAGRVVHLTHPGLMEIWV